MSFQSAFQQALGAGKKKKTSSSADSAASDIVNSFHPGQYAKVNADIAARNKPKNDQIQQQKIQQQKVQQQAQQQQNQKNSLFNKVKNVGKSVAEGFTAGVQPVAKPIARLLPGGTNDLKSENAQIDQNLKLTQQINRLRQSSNPKDKKLADTLDKANKSNITNTSKNVTDTAKEIKSETNPKKIALGVASTAADILTAGNYGKIAAGAKAGKILKGAEVEENAAKANKARSLLTKTQKAKKDVKEVATIAASNGGAGALNAAAAGGDKKDIAKNAAFGAALPEVLRFGGMAASQGASKIIKSPKVASLLDKTKIDQVPAVRGNDKGVNDLITNTKTKSLLSANKPSAINAKVDPEDVAKGIIKPDMQELPISKISITADTVGKPDAAKVAQYVKQIKDGEPIKPVVVQHINGQTFLVDGQKRLAAAQKLGIENVPTVEKAPGKVDVSGKLEVTGSGAEGVPAPATESKQITPAESTVEESVPTNGSAAPDTGAIKDQINKIKNDGSNYDENGFFKPESAKQINTLNKQLNAAGERVPKAEKPVTVTPVKSTSAVETPEIRTSKLADRTETRAIKKGLTSAFGDKPEYAKVNMARQAEAAAQLLKEDPDRLTRIAMGHEAPPEGLLPESAWVAAVNQASKTGDGELLRKLGTESHLVSEATGMGQRIRALGELDPHNPGKAIKDIADARKKAVESRTGQSVTKNVSSEIKKIRAAKPKLEKETWGSFVDSLKC